MPALELGEEPPTGSRLDGYNQVSERLSVGDCFDRERLSMTA